MSEKNNVQTWECGAENKADVIAILNADTLTLTISGNGKMKSYTNWSETRPPWEGENIAHVVVEEGVENIGDFTFNDFIGLISVVIPKSVKIIGEWTFKGCTALESIEIPETGLVEIGEGAFYRCSVLKIFAIPNSVETIGSSAFEGCSLLESINIPKGVRRINGNTFRSCDTLTSITIPANVGILGDLFIFYCQSLTTIINERHTPQPIDKDTFVRSYDKKLLVPASAVNIYKNAYYWKNFSTILPITAENIMGDKTSEQIDSEIDSVNLKIEEHKDEIAKLEQQIEELRYQKALMRGLDGNPKQVANFMSLFNQRDGLKYLTHDVDESGNFDYEAVLTQARKICTDHFESLQIPQTLKELLNEFVFEEKPEWTSFDNQYQVKAIKSGWSAADWQTVKGDKLHPIKFDKFAEIIKDFKRATRIESPNLETLINTVFNDDVFEIETKDLSKADFYTHVGEFKAALETVFEEIQKRTDSDEKKKVSITYKRETCDDYFVRKVMITHHNSFPKRDDKDALIREWLSFEKGSMAKIAAHLQGYCHWSVETRIDNEPLRVNILREKGTLTDEVIDASEVIGFTHILSFYYQ